MREFVTLFERIDQTKSTKEKIEAIKKYFLKVSSEEAAWALFLLSGHKIKRLVGSQKLFDWCIEYTSLPAWLCVESYSQVGDIAETISLLIVKDLKNKKKKEKIDLSLDQWITQKILPLQNLSNEFQKESIFNFWDELDQKGILILNKILTGSLRVGVSHLLTIDALSQTFNISKEILSQKLMGNWEPNQEFYENLKNENHANEIHLNPYPFYLASPLDGFLEKLGEPLEWYAEWKWDGIRAQAIKRKGKVALWSRGNELITHQFPEIEEAISEIEHDIVLDGEILAFNDDLPLPFGALQKRLGRKKVSKSMIEAVPIIFMIYDILEYKGKDIRKLPLIERRAIIENWEKYDRIKLSPIIDFDTWEELTLIKQQAYDNFTEGLILKKKNSVYMSGRRRGNWWKYKIDPKTIDVVLIYAQPGTGWRANLYTDYTFGTWHNGELIPIVKAYSGLSQDEIQILDKWIRKNTLEKFGPVRKVKAEQVFEIAFEGIQLSTRHKSGVALRFPRILRWRQEKPASECVTLDEIKKEFLKI